MLRMT